MVTADSSLDRARFLAAAVALRAGRGGGRIVNRDDRGAASRALARALAGAAALRGSPAERDWMNRIESRRAALAAEHAETDAVFSEGPERGGARWAELRRSGPLAEACRVISVPPLWGRLLMRLIAERRPATCVELGTGFGVSAAFQAAALELNGAGRLVSFEGGESWAAIAREGAERLGLARLEVRVGPLSRTLEPALDELGRVEFGFVDAEHTKESTLAYFDALLPRLASAGILVFDDIDFDEPMWEAWTEIREHPSVATAVSLGRMGIVATG